MAAIYRVQVAYRYRIDPHRPSIRRPRQQAGRGKNGGYMLAKAAAEITIRNVIEALEGTMALTSCLGHSSTCVREGWCTMRGGLSILNQKILETFEQTTLLNLLSTAWKQQ